MGGSYLYCLIEVESFSIETFNSGLFIQHNSLEIYSSGTLSIVHLFLLLGSISWFNHSLMEEHLSCFQFGAISRETEVNM